MTVEEVMNELYKDIIFYNDSDGGITLSGGEVTLQKDFMLDLLKESHKEFHTCIETCGYCDQKILEQALPYLDLILFDIKHMDSEKHKQLTGVPNEQILKNAAFLAQNSIKTILRIPLIPGLNDSADNIMRLGTFAVEHNLNTLEIIPYHLLGLSKYAALGRPYMVEDLRSGSSTEQAVSLLSQSGLQVSVI